MAQPSKSPKNPGAADKTLIVLRAALEHSRFTDIVEASGLAKSSVHRLLQSLVDYEFVTVNEEGNYLAGPAAMALASHAFKNIDISERAQPFMRELARKVKCQVHVGARARNEAVYVAIEESEMPYRIPSDIGDRLPLHSTSIGKCLLAAQSDETVRKYIADVGLPRKTPRTISTANALFAELYQVRDCGYAVDDEENVPGIRCVAVPIRNHMGRVDHAMSITTLALEKTMDEVIELVPFVVETAAKISRSLGSWD
ncbi:IclR family transcriptional regulator [Actinotignum schaalii]|uniref:IclR family transcriptional regulator n=1 Tax=Actinotignum schaalii TaxID=59505 RepID=UPI00373F13F9